MMLLIMMYILKCFDTIQKVINQILTGKDLYKQMIVVSGNDTFPASFLNIFCRLSFGRNENR